MRCSILVPTFRRPQLLRRNLEALAIQTRSPDEILVALRPDEDPEGAATFDAFVSAHPEQPAKKVEVAIAGIVPAENALLAAATGDVVCFLDDDSIARPFWLENLVRHYERDHRVGGVAGPVIPIENGAPQAKKARFRNWVLFPGLILDQSTRHTNRLLGVDHFRGANMSFRRELLEELGGFDTRLRGDCFRFELDACLGIKRLGYRLLFEPDAEIDHHEAPRGGGQDQRFSRSTFTNNAANESYVLLKHYGRGPAGWLHMVFAFAVGNFPCPGLVWSLVGAVPFLKHPHLHGLRALLPSWKGRILGWRAGRGAAA